MPKKPEWMEERLFFKDSYAVSFMELYKQNSIRARGILVTNFDKPERVTAKRFLKQQQIMSVLLAIRAGKTIPAFTLEAYRFNPYTSQAIRRYCRTHLILL